MIYYFFYLIVVIVVGILIGFEIIDIKRLEPHFGISTIVWGSLFSVVLAALSLGYFWGGRFCTSVISDFLNNTGMAKSKNLLEKNSCYHRILVEDTRASRYLYFGNTLQSAMDLDDPADLKLLYLRFISLGLTLRLDVRRVLIIGLGGGSLPRKYQKEFRSMEIDVAEIDPAVIEVAKCYFQFKEGEKLRVHPVDGRLFLSQAIQPYDMILLDAYQANGIPFHLITKEFFEMAEKKLTAQGIMVINVIGSIIGNESKVFRSLVKTLRRVYPQIYIFPVRGSDKLSLNTSQNIILLASKDFERLSIQEIVQRSASIGLNLFPEPPEKIQASYYCDELPDDDVPEYTDDYTPTDNLLHL